jgi:hypothetical protein
MRKVAAVVGAALFVLGAGPAPGVSGLQQSRVGAAELATSTLLRVDRFEECMYAYGCTKYSDGTWSCPIDGVYELCSEA